jgi:hypothetical protein
MPTTALSKTQFEHELDALARLQQQVAATLRPAVEAFLNFANEYRRTLQAGWTQLPAQRNASNTARH